MDSKNSKSYSLAVSFVATASLMSCNNPAALKAAVGHFEGFRVTSTAVEGGPQSQVSVSADVTSVSDSELQVVINTEPASRPVSFTVQTGSAVKNADLEISAASPYLPSAIDFTHSTGNCFKSSSKDELCLDGSEIQLSLTSTYVKFVLDKMPARALPTFETPRSYTVTQLIQRSMNQNFATQASFESVVQAKLTAKQAQMNLLPHVNINTALGLMSISLQSMIKSIGDLIPFVLPDRWFEVAALKDASTAENDGYKVVQASAMNIVQGLALSVLRDEESMRALQANEVNVIQIRDQVVANEIQGSSPLPLGSEAGINVLLDTMDNSIATLKEAISEEKAALSQASGFNNPQAVLEVLPETTAPVTGPLPGTLSDIESQATNRSLQLLQADELIASAKEIKGEKTFEWLDPAGDDNGSIGFGFVDHQKIQQGQIDQLTDDRKQTQSELLVNVQNALSQSSTLFNVYQNDVQSSQQSQNSIDLYQYRFQNGQSPDMSVFATILGQKADSDLAQVNDIYAYKTLKAQLDFLTFSGVYAQIVDEKL